MKLTVENFGPIKKATNITVSPMTIFVGPSNTGKSYLAILIYAILKVLGNRRRHAFELEINRDIRYNIVKITKENSKKPQATIKKIGELMINHWLIFWVNNIADELKKQIIYCFGEEGKNMMENGGHPVIKISGHKNELILNLFSPDKSRLAIRRKREIINFFSSTIGRTYLEILMDQRYLKMLAQEDESDHSIYLISEWFLERFTLILLEQSGLEKSNQFARSHYLPAIRGGIMQSHRTLVSALIERAPMAGLDSRFSPIPLFSGVLSDFMNKLIHVSDANKGSSRFHRFHNPSAGKEEKEKLREISDALDNRILDGEIYAQSSETRYPDFRYVFQKGEKRQDLPLMNASSMVSELAPVSLFIRHYVGDGDLFILEEPEAHLHPGAQREISNILVQLVNAGVYVLITTHSDNILEQIGNCMQAAEVPENSRPKGLKDEKQVLNQKKVSVYLFKPLQKRKSKSTTVKKIQFDPEIGILTEDHLEVSSALYNETATLLNGRTDNND